MSKDGSIRKEKITLLKECAMSLFVNSEHYADVVCTCTDIYMERLPEVGYIPYFQLTSSRYIQLTWFRRMGIAGNINIKW